MLQRYLSDLVENHFQGRHLISLPRPIGGGNNTLGPIIIALSNATAFQMGLYYSLLYLWKKYS
jgi:hypothetical protein